MRDDLSVAEEVLLGLEDELHDQTRNIDPLPRSSRCTLLRKILESKFDFDPRNHWISTSVELTPEEEKDVDQEFGSGAFSVDSDPIDDEISDQDETILVYVGWFSKKLGVNTVAS